MDGTTGNGGTAGTASGGGTDPGTSGAGETTTGSDGTDPVAPTTGTGGGEATGTTGAVDPCPVGSRGCACEGASCDGDLICREGWCTPPDLAFVPDEGPTRQGCNPGGACQPDEGPAHDVRVSPFFIELTEVTQASFLECIRDGLCDYPTAGCSDDFDPDLRGDLPMVCVDHGDARDYCDWAMRRLPTEAEWEKAARGPQARTYPWGEAAPTCDVVRFSDCSQTLPTTANSNPGGRSWVGALNMAGNVREIVADWYGSNAYDGRDGLDPAISDPTGPVSGVNRVVRGGGFDDPAQDLRTTARFTTDEAPDGSTGFRCAEDLNP